MRLLSLFCLSGCCKLSLPPASLSPLVLCPHSLPFLPCPYSPSLSFSPHLPLLQSPLMATCLSIIDILTGLTSRPPVAPLFLQPALLHQNPHETHSHIHRCTSLCECVRQKLWSVYWVVCVVCGVCVQVSETERERLSESPHTARGEFLYLDPYKRLFPASNCAYTRLSNTLQCLYSSVTLCGQSCASACTAAFKLVLIS